MKLKIFWPTRIATATPPVFSPRAGEKGFTLVEVLIAMLILATGILALSMMMRQSVGSTDYGRKVTTAENLALQQLELIKGRPYLDTPPGTVIEDYGSIAGFPEFRRETQCVVLQGITLTAPEGFLKQVTVTVRWSAVGSIGQGGAVPLTTYVTQ